MRKWFTLSLVFLVLFAVVASANAAPVTRAKDAVSPTAKIPQRGAPEIAVRPYPSYVYYSELLPILQSIDARSARVTMKQTGLSANGNPMWLVTVTGKWPSQAVKNRNMKYRSLVATNPAKAKKMLTAKSGIRAPVFLNASIHGGETTGVDASLAILKRLAFSNDSQTRNILKNCVVFINPIQNPDGRITDLRANGNGFDLNRDFITLTQPETVATVKQIKAYHPVTFLDLHGYVNPMLIEPCTTPHNPSLEYDLFIKWAQPLAETMKSTLESKTGMTAQIPYQWGTEKDKLGKVNEGWDDYGPYYTGMIAQQMGSLGYTMETPYKTQDGVDAHYWTSWSMMNYVVKNRLPIMKDQAEIFRRGDLNIPDSTTGRPWAGNMTEMLRPVPWGDPAFPYSNVVGDVEFPYAYVVPVDAAMQKDPLQAYKFINHARMYGVEVHVARASFTVGATTYPAGSYVIRTQQPLRSLVNNLLWEGEDVKAQYGVSSMYDISAWSLPEIWGFDAAAASAPFNAALTKVTAVVGKAGMVMGAGPVYWFGGDTNQSVLVVNEMLQRLYGVGMVHQALAAPHDAIPLGAFVVDTTDTPGAKGYLDRVAADYGIDFMTADGLTLDMVATLARPSVSVAVDAQTVWVLKSVLGFYNVAVNAGSLSNSTTAYVSSSSSTAGGTTSTSLANVQTWLNGATAARQRTYVGIVRGAGQSWATGLLPAVTVANDADSADNGIVVAEYAADDIYTAGYPQNDYAFCYPPYWFTEASDAVSTDITYRAGITGPFHSGFWNNDDAAAVDTAAMVSGTYDGAAVADFNRVVFMGFHPTYRAMEENTYLLVARAIFLSSATFPAN
jgi:hypothetical protein